jgi:hypothetical protein
MLHDDPCRIPLAIQAMMLQHFGIAASDCVRSAAFAASYAMKTE